MKQVNHKIKTHIVKDNVTKKMIRYQHMTLGRQQRLRVKMMWAKRLLPVANAELSKQRCEIRGVWDVATKTKSQRLWRKGKVLLYDET